MMLNDKQKLEVSNLLKMIRRASFKDFEGVEALALARAYHWLESLLVPPPPAPTTLPKDVPLPAPLLPVVEEKNTIIPASVSVDVPKKSRKKAK